MRWTDGKQLTIAHQKSSETLFTSDPHHSPLYPQARIGEEVSLLNRIPKILGITLDILFAFGPHSCDCIEWASRAINVMIVLAELRWSEDIRLWWRHTALVKTYDYHNDNGIICSILNYAVPSGSPKCPHIWTNLRLSRTRSWRFRLAATKRPRCASSELRLEFSPVGVSGTIFTAILRMQTQTLSSQPVSRHRP